LNLDVIPDCFKPLKLKVQFLSIAREDYMDTELPFWLQFIFPRYHQSFNVHKR